MMASNASSADRQRGICGTFMERLSEDIGAASSAAIGQTASVAALEVLSSKNRRAKLNAIRDACRAYITGMVRKSLGLLLVKATGSAGRVVETTLIPIARTS
jgi:hypothetical protein